MNRQKLPPPVRAVTVIALIAFMTVVTGTARPAASSTSQCDTNVGTNTPVLLVHGFTEQPTGPNGVWTSGTPTMEEAIRDNVPGVTVVTPFSYWSAGQATDWVTDPRIGAALASDIICLADASLAHGGPGKVIIVAHSMGGLAVRCAVNPACVGKGHQAANADQIGLVVTLGTPNLGSALGNLAQWIRPKAHVKPPGAVETAESFLCQQLPGCPQLTAKFAVPSTAPAPGSVQAKAASPAARAMQIGSPELDPKKTGGLAPLPSKIELDAIAGKITLTTTLFSIGPIPITANVGDLGDIVVSVQSAQDPQGHPGPGAWQPTLDCGSVPIDALTGWAAEKVVLGQPLVDCYHLNETTDPAWQADVVAAIRPVASALHLLTCTPDALTKGLVAANPQLNSFSWKLRSWACAKHWAVADIFAPSVGAGTAFLQQTASGWKSDGLGEVNCSQIPGPLATPLPAQGLTVSLLDKAGICGQPSTSSPAGSAIPAFYIHNGYVLGSLYKYPGFPSSFGLDNHDGITGLHWAKVSPTTASATGTLNVDNCTPDCAQGADVTYPVRVIASDPKNCQVSVYQPYSDTPHAVQAYLFTNVTIVPLSGSPPAGYIGELPLYPLHC